MDKDKPNKFPKNNPLTIAKVANGYKIIASKEQFLYEPERAGTYPNEEYVFSDLKSAEEFITEHFEQL